MGPNDEPRLLQTWLTFMQDGKGRDSRDVSIILHCVLDALDDRSLPFCADLLRALERNERQLEVMRRLLQRRLVPRLNGPCINTSRPKYSFTKNELTHQCGLHCGELLQVVRTPLRHRSCRLREVMSVYQPHHIHEHERRRLPASSFGNRSTHRDLRSAAESLAVPS